jgi:phosphoserine phosphatase RsbU/P
MLEAGLQVQRPDLLRLNSEAASLERSRPTVEQITMKILIAEDDSVSRRLLETILSKAGFETVSAPTGDIAWQILQQPSGPRLAVVDWHMPGLSGVEICRNVRSHSLLNPQTYVILLTTRTGTGDLVTGLQSGANDYVTKPFDRQELLARIDVGRRVVELQSMLAQRIYQLEDALAQVQRLQQLLPICAYCKRIRDDKDYWHQVEHYFESHTHTQFTHSVCPDCLPKMQGGIGKPATTEEEPPLGSS